MTYLPLFRLCEGFSPWQSRNPKPKQSYWSRVLQVDRVVAPLLAMTYLPLFRLCEGVSPWQSRRALTAAVAAAEVPAGGSRRRSAPRDDVRGRLLAMTFVPFPSLRGR